MLRRVFRWLGAGAAFSLSITAGGLALLFLSTPTVDFLVRDNPRTTAPIEKAKALGLSVVWTTVSYEDISTDLKVAVVVAEDFRFFLHGGFDSYEIKAALKDAVTRGRIRGASTITQQLARNLWLSSDRTATRKLTEAVLAWKLERRLSKKRILELYLNTAIFGPETFGVEAAAQRYFGIPASMISRTQAAQLAAALPAPSRWFPGSESPRATRHFERIMNRMNQASGLRRLLENQQ